MRAGYQVGESLFAELPGRRSLLHVIGERPGTGLNTETGAEGAILLVPTNLD